ncbi:hypothetical protein EO244_16440 [Ancylomarina salipaludis]|uniref:Uncharacterized protein n=1 Tax=Ancylomarina salipaludis TaxID=2501299 RepID=A0A4Q1JHZ6_9BACT|nr:hypothetical protein [Ancylomarina salipaludis]RXQ87395.1 hypothetical protein EO244_16440 [Ancylomarina salipaludis]
MAELESISPDRFRSLLETKSDISNYHITEEVIIDNDYIVGNKAVTITNCTFNFEFQIKGIQLNQKYFFINCIFTQRFLAVDLELKNLQFSNCTFNQYFTSKNLKAFLIHFEFCHFDLQKTLIIDQFKAEKFKFLKNESNRDIQLIPQDVRLIALAGSESKNSITLSSRGNKNVIDNLFLEFNSNHKTDFLLRNLNVRYAQIHGELKESTLSINNVKLQIGIIKYFFNFGNMLINSLLPLSEASILVMKGANLGNAIISSTDFSKFTTVEVSNCNLVDIVPVNIVWCKSNSLKAKNSLNDRKETYRQLKIVADKNLDVPTKLMFHQYEMRAYLKILKCQKGNFSDRFILRTNQISNNHGLSWHFSLFWLLGFSILWYTLAKYTLGETVYAPELIGSEIGKFINFINPAHYFGRIFDAKSDIYTTNARLFDGLSRITSAYFIYQFVGAFRKYSKK